MSRAALSLFVFAIYLIVVGVLLIVAPNVFLGLLGMPPSSEVWIRVVGMLALILAAYDMIAARNEWREFFRCSVYTRASVILFACAFVALELGPSQLILLGAIDLASAIWTFVAMRGEISTARPG